MPLEYSFWDGREFVVYGALAKGCLLYTSRCV